MSEDRKAHTVRVSAVPAQSIWLGVLRLVPWLVFGPITGVMSEAAVAAFRRGRPVLGGFWVLLNVAVLIGIPMLTAAILAHSAGHRA
jgi:hypothetical protein